MFWQFDICLRTLRYQIILLLGNNAGMKTIRTWIRTKSGRLVERLIVLTEEDYAALQAGGQDALVRQVFVWKILNSL